jgi:AraC-like DNA-binding protein
MDRPAGGSRWTRSGAFETDLIASEAMSLEYVPAPPDLQPYVTTFYLFRCDESVIRDIQPAAVGQLQIYLRGRGRMHYPHGRTDLSFPETLQGPTTVAAPFEVDGPFHAFGGALSALGWAALTGLRADRAADRLLDASAILGPDAAVLGRELRETYQAEPGTDGSRLAERAVAFIRPRLRPVPWKHMELIQRVPQWLGTGFNPPVEALHAMGGYSQRQVQRLVTRYFGSSPTLLARAYRATRVVALLSQPGVTDEQVAALTNEFYDQPHMIREIRQFAGRTPARLLAENDSILRQLLDVRNFREIKPNVAPLPPLETGTGDA